MAENVTKCSDDGAAPHVFVTRAPSRKRKRSPSRPVTYTEFVLKKVNLGSEDAISQVNSDLVLSLLLCSSLFTASSAISQVASACGVSRHIFTRFGTKDKVATLWPAEKQLHNSIV
jgi:hypothetical protein